MEDDIVDDKQIEEKKDEGNRENMEPGDSGENRENIDGDNKDAKDQHISVLDENNNIIEPQAKKKKVKPIKTKTINQQ